MMITLEMILTRFFQEHPEAETGYPQTEHPILGIRLLPEKTDDISRDYLYISTVYREEQIARIDASVLVVCLVSNSEIISHSENVILLNTNLEPAESFNCLQKCYSDFAEWSRQLDFAVFRNADFQEIIDLSSAILPSPVMVYDPALKLLAYSANYETLKDPLFQNAIKNGYLDIQTVKYFEKSNTFEQINISGSLASEADSYRGHADFVQAINIHNELAVYCILLYPEGHSRSYVRQLFRILCEAFRSLLEKQHATFLRDRSVTDYFLMDLLDNPDTSREQIQERIFFNDLDYEGNFCLLSVHSDVRKKSSEKFFIQYLRNNMIHCRIFPYQEGIVILYILPESVSSTYKSYLTGQLQSVFRDFSGNKIRIYISRPFFTIGEFSDAYLQAENIRKIASTSIIGQSISPTQEEEIFFFEDYWITDLLYQNSAKNKSFFYCEPCLLELLKKNTKKSRQQIRILYEYINRDRNYTAVAQALHMHRNNVIYHIDRLEEQYHLSLDDSALRLRLLLSFQILFYEGKKKQIFEMPVNHE